MIPEVRACSTLSALPHHWIYRENAGALDRTRAAVGTWLCARPRDWLGQVAAVALDPWRGNASALVAPLGHATVVVDHFPRHPAGQPGGRPGAPSPAAGHPWHRGRKRDPLYRIRKLLLTAGEQLTGRDGRGCELAWRLVIPAVRWPRPGRARSCCGPSTPRTSCRRPAPHWTGSTAGLMASRSPSCPAWLAPYGPGRPRSSLGIPPTAAPTAHRGRQLADQDRPCGRPAAALRPGNDTTLTVVPTHPPHQVARLTRGVPSVWHQRPSTSDGHASP